MNLHFLLFKEPSGFQYTLDIAHSLLLKAFSCSPQMIQVHEIHICKVLILSGHTPDE